MSVHYFTLDEILSQTDAWAQALSIAPLAPLPKAADFEQVIFTGCGSAYYLSLAASALYQELTGRTARAVPAGELLLNPQNALPESGGKLLLIAVSRSGTTTETLRAVEQFRKAGRGPVIVISNYAAGLSQQADVPIVIDKGQEESVAQTRSFASMYVAATAVCARMSGRFELLDAMSALPIVGRRLLQACEPLVRELGGDLNLDRFCFLGSGIRYGLACEANLKMKEMSLTHSEPFHFLEFRHGPKSLAGPGALVVGLLSDKNRVHERAVLDEMKVLDARILSLAESEAEIAFESGIPESVRAILYLPALQLMAFYRSLAKGLNPDRPHNLTAVVQLSL
jgi:glucosamine--fructose-6-phosphate aminotransferase (isomerizing)